MMQPGTDIAEWIDVERRYHVRVWPVSSTAMAGFPSPADDYLDRPLDFKELLIENPAATFAVRIGGDSMIGIGIFPGDIAIVNRAKETVDRAIVLALVDGSFTVKPFRRRPTGPSAPASAWRSPCCSTPASAARMWSACRGATSRMESSASCR